MSNPETKRRWYANLPKERRQAIIAKQAARNVRAREAARARGECICGEPLARWSDGRLMSGCRTCLDKAKFNRESSVEARSPEQVERDRVWAKAYQAALREAKRQSLPREVALERARAVARDARRACVEQQMQRQQGEAA